MNFNVREVGLELNILLRREDCVFDKAPSCFDNEVGSVERCKWETVITF